MKKNTLIYLIALIIVVLIISLICFISNKNEITNQDEINKFVSESNLEILLDLANFNLTEYSDKNLLEVAMRLAEKNGHMNESVEGDYIQYVNQSTLHELIFELTNINIEAPIQIEDFYYVYDSENEYYYCIPLDFAKFEISKINHVYVTDNIYTVECVATKTEEDEIIEEKTITTKLKYMPNGSYTNYQILSQEISK